MPGPGKWHLRGPVISMLNHICESDGVGSWTLLCLPEAAGTVWRVRGDPLSLQPEIRHIRRVTRFTEGTSDATMCSQGLPTCTRKPRNERRHEHAGGLPPEPCLPYNLQRQRGPSPFQIERMVQTPKTKQTHWPPRCIVHEVRLVFSSPLTRSIYTDSKSTPHLWIGLHTYIPVIIQTCIARRFLPLSSLPRVLFQWALLCFKRGSTSKQPKW